jgi:hypothetical protein
MKTLGLALLLCVTLPSMADDFSGVYTCQGVDSHEGPYEGKVTLKLLPEHSFEGYSSYDFKLEVPQYGTYLGHAAAHGNHVAMHFALPAVAGVYGGKTQDFGTGIAEFKQLDGRWTFKKFYYEPAYMGGNTGFEDCVKGA